MGGEEGRDDANEGAGGDEADDDDRPESGNEVDSGLDGDAEFGGAVADTEEGADDKGGGDNRGDDAVVDGFNEEWAADERAVRADEFHHVDFFAAVEDGHADGVEDDESGDDDENTTSNESASLDEVGHVSDAVDGFAAVGEEGRFAVGVEGVADEVVVFDDGFEFADVVDVDDVDVDDPGHFVGCFTEGSEGVWVVAVADREVGAGFFWGGYFYTRDAF